MIIDIVTLFPEYFDTPLRSSIIGKSIKNKVVSVNIINIREFADAPHFITDDRPFGGGPGMVMKIDPIYKALSSIGAKRGTEGWCIALTSAKGTLYTQQLALSWSTLTRLTIICGHYEGVDERVAENLIDCEIRIGDYVLTGGEPAASVLFDSVVRLLPGTVGNSESIVGESHSTPGRLSHPQYTRPQEFQGWKVPKQLVSGNHAAIEKWRKDQT